MFFVIFISSLITNERRVRSSERRREGKKEEARPFAILASFLSFETSHSYHLARSVFSVISPSAYCFTDMCWEALQWKEGTDCIYRQEMVGHSSGYARRFRLILRDILNKGYFWDGRKERHLCLCVASIKINKLINGWLLEIDFFSSFFFWFFCDQFKYKL